MAEYITVKEAAVRKGVSAPTIYAAIERGEIPAERVLGRFIGLKPEDVDAFQPAPYGAREGVKRRRGPGRSKKIESEEAS